MTSPSKILVACLGALALTSDAAAVATPVGLSGRSDNSNFAPDGSSAANLAGTPAQWIGVHRSLNQFFEALDAKDFAAMGSHLAPDAFANLSQPGSTDLHGRANITAAISRNVAAVNTQHDITSFVVDFPPSPGGGTVANSTSYFIIAIFGVQGDAAGKQSQYYGKLNDTWVLQKDSWQVKTRYVTYTGPGFGNL